MKSNILKYGLVMGVTTMMMASCADKLDLGPIDYFGSGNYWKTEAQVDGYIDGLHKHLRDYDWTHQVIFGELRSGIYNNGVGSDGSSLANLDIVNQNFDADHTGVSTFGGAYGRITNCNLFIARVTSADYVPEAKKNYYLGIAYGLRACYYYDLYRVYGGVPLRLDVAVVDGETDPTKLYMGRSKPSEVMAQSKSDLAKSLEYFGDVNNFDPYNRGKKAYWSKAATEALAADVYMWNAKVTIGDQKATPADLTVAKQHLLTLVNTYGLTMLDNFADVFDSKSHKSNDEVIFAIRYVEGEATNGGWPYYTYSMTTGQLHTKAYQENGASWNDDPFGLKTGYVQRYEYTLDLFRTYDKTDSRRLATMTPAYLMSNTTQQPDSLVGVPACKNIGKINATGDRVFDGDDIYYRLPWVYLSLAEIANEEGNNSDVEKYINLVRKRAYGSNWSAAYQYTAGDYTTNTLAILHEKDKEFVQEGQRWWDLNRMTLTKGGEHLVFCKEGSVLGNLPILNKATEAHKVLWPLDKTILGNDPLLKQTPGYATGDQEEEQW